MGIELAAAGVGAGILGATGQAKWIPIVICAAVGIHFFPLASVFQLPRLVALGVVMLVVAVVALVVGLTSHQDPASITGVGAGCCLVASTLLGLVGGHSGRRASTD